MGANLDFSKEAQNELAEIEKQFLEVQAEIDAFFEKENVTPGVKELFVLEPKRAALLATYQASLSIAKRSRAGKGNVKVIKEKTLDSKIEAEIRKQLKNRGFTDSQIEAEVNEIKETLASRSVNAYVSPLTGDLSLIHI